MEEWKVIEDYPKYEVSNLGNVRSTCRTLLRILRPGMMTSGYLFVQLCNEGKNKNYSVHRLVGRAFLPNPDNLNEIDHINRNRLDNRVENLRWVSRSDNLLNRTLPIPLSGHQYISKTRPGTFQVRLRRPGLTYNKTFLTLEEAIRERDAVLNN